MEFTIHSLGDAAFLDQILNAVAMITGTGSFHQMISIGLLLGFVMICVQSLMQGAKEIDVKQIFVAWLVYAMMFGPSATVIIEDSVSGRVRVVDNVPIGPAFAGGVISNIGFGITKLFEQGYGVVSPGITDGAYFGESLAILHDVRRKAFDSNIFSALDHAAGGGHIDIKASLTNYIQECTLSKIDMGLSSPDELAKAPVMEAMEFGSGNLMTLMFLERGLVNGKAYTCSEGWAALSKALDSNITSSTVSSTLNGLLGYTGSFGVEASPDGIEIRMSNALNALGKGSTNAFDYLKASLIEPVYMAAAEGRYKDFQDFNTALAINQAIQQRNLQWTAEQSMFMTTVRPMITFFEGFVYAITPILAFLILLGKNGITLAGKYAQVIIWVQLWLPVLSIINLFIHTASTGEMALNGGLGQLNSMYALNTTSDILQTWLGTGGMLAAATPVIALFIVTGSTYAFAGLANRINGADHFNEKSVVPDAKNQGPLLNIGAANTYAANEGVQTTGSHNYLADISANKGATAQVSHLEKIAESTGINFQETLGKTLSSGASKESVAARSREAANVLQSTDSQAYDAAHQQVRNWMEKNSYDLSNSHDVVGAVVLSATAGGDLGVSTNLLKPTGRGSNSKDIVPYTGDEPEVEPNNTTRTTGVGGGVTATGSAADRESNSEKKSSGDSSTLADAVTFKKSTLSNFQDSLAEKIARSTNDTWKTSSGEQDQNSLVESAQEAVQAERALSQAVTWQQGLGSSTQFNTGNVAGTLSGENPNHTPEFNANMDKQRRIASDAAKSVDKQEFNQLMDLYQSPAFSFSRNKAEAAAAMQVLASDGSLGSYNTLISTLDSMGYVDKDNIGLQDMGRNNSDLQTADVDRGTRQKVEKATNNITTPEIGATGTEVNEILGQDVSANSVDGTDPMTSDTYHNYEQNSQEQLENAVQMQRNAGSEELKRAENRLLNANPDISKASGIFGFWENYRDAEDGTVKFMTGGAERAYDSASDAFNGEVIRINSMSPEERQNYMNDLDDKDGSMFMGIVGSAISWLKGDTNTQEATEGMDLDQLGAFYGAAYTLSKAAGKEGLDSFYENFNKDFKETVAEKAEAQGLTSNQADVMAHQYATGLGAVMSTWTGSDGTLFQSGYRGTDRAVEVMKEDYAHLYGVRDENGSLKTETQYFDIYNDRGEKTGGIEEIEIPVLNQKGEELHAKAVEILQASSFAGKNQSGTYQTAIKAHNDEMKEFKSM